ncbi:MAG: site-specific DNA-methyltransferase [Candidatus Nitrosocosmicus sp.]|nr:site-specific DNA-methyltransferase [Candidatus Nitrosocosmicus sp.]
MTIQSRLDNIPYKNIETKNGRYHKFYLEDCVSGIRKYLTDNSIDVVITSPPYNISKNYGSYDDNLPRNEYLLWLGQVGKEIKRVLRNNGSFFLNFGNRPSDQWLAWDVANIMREEFKLQNVIHWIKSISIQSEKVAKNQDLPDNITMGHFKSIVSNRFVNDCHEYIFHFTKDANTKIQKIVNRSSLSRQNKYQEMEVSKG